ncbi:MAG: hypothetical protein PHD51_04125 [Patescibacteria group bacterium]|nr:hypothetical protein [Patescibacteria group bacterium]MDD5490813.1 hypothetical protein [Patescibacteria group bacterium]
MKNKAMPDYYSFSQRREAYLGYSKRRRPSYKFIFLFLIIAAALLAVAIILIFFPGDRLIDYAPVDKVVYIHLNYSDDKVSAELVRELNRFWGFPEEFSGEEMAWVVLPDGQRFFLARFFSRPNTWPANLTIKDFSNDTVAVGASSANTELLYRDIFWKIFSNPRAYFYFKIPGSDVGRGHIDTSKHAAPLPWERYLFSNIKLPENIYISLARNNNQLIVDFNFPHSKLTAASFINSFAEKPLLYLRGFNFFDLYGESKKYIPKNILASGEKDFDELGDILRGEGELLVEFEDENNPVDIKNFLRNNFLLIVNISSKEFDPAKLANVLKRVVGYLYPEEKEVVLPDGRAIEFLPKEIIADFTETTPGGPRILESEGIPLKISYQIISQGKKNFLFLSNSEDLVKEYTKTAGQLSEEKLLGVLDIRDKGGYINLEKITKNNDFLANFSEILFTSDKITGFLK